MRQMAAFLVLLVCFSAQADEQELRTTLAFDRAEGESLDCYVKDESLLGAIAEIIDGDDITTQRGLAVAKAYLTVAQADESQWPEATSAALEWLDITPAYNRYQPNFDIWKLLFDFWVKYEDTQIEKHEYLGQILLKAIDNWRGTIGESYETEATEIVGKYHMNRAFSFVSLLKDECENCRECRQNKDAMEFHAKLAFENYDHLLPLPKAKLFMAFAFGFGFGADKNLEKALSILSALLTGSEEFARTKAIRTGYDTARREQLTKRIKEFAERDRELTEMALRFFFQLWCEKLTDQNRWHKATPTLVFFARLYKDLFPETASAYFAEQKAAEAAPAALFSVINN